MAYQVQVVPKRKRRKLQGGKTKKTARELEVIESCQPRPLVNDGTFCDVTKPLFAELAGISTPSAFPKNAVLFLEGQKPLGIFVIKYGRVKLSTSSSDGKSIIVRVTEAGEIVGLPGAISGKHHELTAEALEAVRADFIPRQAFLQVLRQRGEAAVNIAQFLAEIYRSTLAEVRYLALSGSTAEKLARFLLDLPAHPIPGNGHVRTTLTLTHREIAERIGASRETITRLFASFKRERLILVRGSTLILADKAGLERMVDA